MPLEAREFLCAWADGGAPQWLGGEHLRGTPALEEWEAALEEVPEVHDAPAVVAAKVGC